MGGPDETGQRLELTHSLKSYTAHQANLLLHRNGPFWQRESYDHWVRHDDELERIVVYIAANPINAGPVAEPHAWYFSSSHHRFPLDGSYCGWLP